MLWARVWWQMELLGRAHGDGVALVDLLLELGVQQAAGLNTSQSRLPILRPVSRECFRF